MKIRILALLLCLVAVASAKDMNGFAGIRFGLTREKVIEEILKLGYDPLGQTTQNDRLVIPVYELGDLPVEVSFMFNRNGKFHCFEIRTGRVDMDRYAKVVDAVKKDRIPTVFCESTVNGKAMQQVAKETGATFNQDDDHLLYVDSLSAGNGPVPTYLDLLRHDAEAIISGLTAKQR